ncbi:hypothetical protein HPB49_013333 [Dermacentor silvarum]|uniref:Uncharacterized protein n=1 Tax=Dermacentor silvarum TaxID=543639 RepID=A0ACB8CF93_DERSI|nr:hypothetical protein HPB49_013333 [Dermacentor silvarum]
MADLSALRGYDPDAMAWATIPVTAGQQSAAADPIRNEELFRMVKRRSQRKTMMMAPLVPPAGKAPSTQTGSATRAAQGSGAKCGKPTTTWKPQPLPRPHPEDFVVIIKPREPVALRDVFQHGAVGAAFATLVGVQKVVTLNLLFSPEQNLIVASTREAEAAAQLLGDFELQTDEAKMAAHGHLKQHGEDVCYGVVTVVNHETTATLRQALQWRAGELLDIGKFGTSNKARLTFTGSTIPACGLCGTIGHRADSCPSPANATCGLGGQQVGLLAGVRTPHECNPKCAVCGGSHATNSRECTAKYRQPKMTTPQQNGLPKSGKKTRHHAAFSRGGSRHVDVTTQQAPPRGRDVKGEAAQQPPPHDGKGNRGQQQQQRNGAGARSLGERIEIWQTDIDDDEDCTLAGLDIKTLVLPTGSGAAPLILNCPTKPWRKTLNRALRVAGRDPLLIVGDFNAPSRVWGYRREEKRGRKLAEFTSTPGLTLHTDPVPQLEWQHP